MVLELENKPKKVFWDHGENQGSNTRWLKIHEKHDFECKDPLMRQEFEL